MRTQQTQSSGNLVSSDSQTIETAHQSVLLQEVINWLDVQKDDIVFDGTLGAGGHSLALGKFLSKDGILMGTDVDGQALERTKKRLSVLDTQTIFVHDNFRNFNNVLANADVSQVNKILLDLGWSSDQISGDNRGMSFMRDEPLSMKLSDVPSDTQIDAHTIVNEWSQESLNDIISGWGEERYAYKIARKICEVREQKEIKTTFDLVDIIRSAVPGHYRNGRIHPATRTFQALRIAVNDELGALKTALEEMVTSLLPKGRIVVISFHSLEDRIVKRTFKKWKEEGIGQPLTKKPIMATEQEVEDNKRARSAKMRIFEKYE